VRGDLERGFIDVMLGELLEGIDSCMVRKITICLTEASGGCSIKVIACHGTSVLAQGSRMAVLRWWCVLWPSGLPSRSLSRSFFKSPEISIGGLMATGSRLEVGEEDRAYIERVFLLAAALEVKLLLELG